MVAAVSRENDDEETLAIGFQVEPCIVQANVYFKKGDLPQDFKDRIAALKIVRRNHVRSTNSIRLA